MSFDFTERTKASVYDIKNFTALEGRRYAVLRIGYAKTL